MTPDQLAARENVDKFSLDGQTLVIGKVDPTKSVDETARLTAIGRMEPTKTVGSKPKRYRIKKCEAKGRVPDGPADVLFVCQKDGSHEVTDDPETWHHERTMVEMADGSAREFDVKWRDLGLVKFRRRLRNLKVVKA